MNARTLYETDQKQWSKSGVVRIIQITLDTNSLIDVEEKRNGYLDILKLKEFHDRGIVNLRIVAISASEKVIDNQRIRNYSLFERYLKEIKFGDLDQLYPFLIWNITFHEYICF